MATATLTKSTARRERIVESLPPVFLAFAVNGFWLYLAVLDLVGVETRAAFTAVYYASLGGAMVFFAWRGKELIWARLRGSSALPRVWTISAAALAAWFLANVALLSSGTVARDAAGLLVLSSLPSALLVLALDRAQVRVAAAACVLLGAALALVSLVAFVRDPARSTRFSPIDELNPISAAQVTALAAVVLLAWWVTQPRSRVLQTAAAVVLIAVTVIPGSRGALLALLAGCIALAVVAWRRSWSVLVPAVVLGLALGTFGSAVSGSDYYYSVDIPGLQGRLDPPASGVDFTGEETEAAPGQVPISTLAIRRHLLTKALRESAESPVVGNGVGMLVDDSPDTLRMVRAGRLESGVTTHPHNVLVESLYSLGVIGLGLFLTVVGASGLALVRLVRRGAHLLTVRFALAFAAVAAVNSSISGEIGSDAYLWVALALPVALYADTLRETVRETELETSSR